MSVHLVLAHPLGDSLNAHLAGRIAKRLGELGQSVDQLDLYAEDFAPSLTAHERAHHYVDPQPGADVLALRARLAAAEHLVIVTPTWWFSLPAILKGGARVLYVSNEHPETLVRLVPSDGLEPLVKNHVKRLRAARTMHVGSAAGTGVDKADSAAALAAAVRQLQTHSRRCGGRCAGRKTGGNDGL